MLSPACTPGATPTGGSLTPVVPAGLTGHLAYIYDGGLWTLDLRSGRAEQIQAPPERGQIQWARWSPDGRQLVYGTFQTLNAGNPVAEVYVVGADGKGPRQLVRGEAGDFFQSPVWAPDGQSVYVIHTVQRPGERARTIDRIDVATGAQQIASRVFGFGLRRFDVSPDGRSLAAVTVGDAGIGLAVIQIADDDSGDYRWLVPEGEFAEMDAPRFDPTSQHVLFSASKSAAPKGQAPWGVAVAYAHGAPMSVYTVALAGGSPKLVSAIELDDPVSAWSPDGARVAILSSEALAIMPVAGGHAAPLIQPGSMGTVDWIGP